MFAPFGPLNWLFDLAWLSGDPHKQSMRDKISQTYVILLNARPEGTARVVHSHYDILGYTFLVKELEDRGTRGARTAAT